jgi:hypothetical protein
MPKNFITFLLVGGYRKTKIILTLFNNLIDFRIILFTTFVSLINQLNLFIMTKKIKENIISNTKLLDDKYWDIIQKKVDNCLKKYLKRIYNLE